MQTPKQITQMSSSIKPNSLKSSGFASDIEKAGKLVRTAERLLDEIKQHIGRNDRESAVEASFRYEENAEKLVNQARLIPVNSGDTRARCIVHDIISRENGCEAEYTEQGWFHIKMPWLLPKKEKGNPSFIRATLDTALRNFFKTIPNRRFQDPCVFVVCHHYDKNRPEREYRDHDNIELNAVVDTVALYTMVDDSPLRCRHYYCSVTSDTDFTEIFLVPVTDFVNWLKIYDSAI